ncbi:MAG TPA: hypothetical protein VF384_04865 [Planctomycetota bacterium]
MKRTNAAAPSPGHDANPISPFSIARTCHVVTSRSEGAGKK